MATITRAQWGAGPHRAGTIPTPVSRLFGHHSVTPFWTGAAAARNLQSIARSRGFLDISYSWLADRADNAIEGRGWGRSGAHTSGYNTTAHALCFVGNLDTTSMPAGMIRAAVRVVRSHARVGPGRITHAHSDVSSTACPGRYARAKIATINLAAAGTPAPAPGGDDFMSALSDGEQKEVLSAARYINKAKPPSNTALVWLLVHTLSPDHEGHRVRVGDWDERVQKQFELLLKAHLPETIRDTLREELTRLLDQTDEVD